MDTEVEASFSKIFNELNKFRKEDKYCDVNIIVDGKTFACHRAILAASCQYFDILLNSGFQESAKTDIPLNEIDAEAFEEILDFIYTGKMKITSENAYRLLTNSHFFGLQYVEDICVEYIDKDLPIDNLLEVCIFIILIKKESIKWKILEHVAENFAFVSTHDSFADMPFDVLESVLMAIKSRNEKSSVIVEGDEILRAITNWVKKDLESRKEHVRRLLEFVPLTICYREILEELLTGKPVEVRYCQLQEEKENRELSPKYATRTDSPLKSYSSAASQKERGHSLEPTVNLYAKEVNERTFNVFSNVNLLTLDKKGRWNWEKSCCSLVSNFKTVCLNGRQYFLVHAENRGNLFWCTDESGKKVSLKAPPETVFNYSLASINNVVYMYDVGINIQKESKIYAYICEIDEWILVSQDQNIPRNAVVVSLNEKLYVIGGSGADSRTLCFDYRTNNNWYSMVNSYRVCSAAACAYERKIYVSGGGSTRLKVLDLVADKWLDLESMKISRINHAFLPFKKHLWAIGADMSAEMYNPESNSWSEIVSVPEDMRTNDGIIKVNVIKDAIVL